MEAKTQADFRGQQLINIAPLASAMKNEIQRRLYEVRHDDTTMAAMGDLINFDIIEGHKENIQSLPGGRSVKALASTFAPQSLLSPTPTPGATREINDTIRQEFELEIIAIADYDDPLDVYDRYVKWNLGAYPSAQATPESQLRPLLERATKAFQTASHYKNDPRYLKLWLTYIRLFSDAPRETFAYLARHSIGEGLALFYEVFAAWLEGAGRWAQADEVYRLGIEREARPAERLLRKFGEFQHRFESRVQQGDEPSSPALPTVRPALVAKQDPFASSTPRPADPQAQRPTSSARGSSSRGGRQKLTIFSDADASAPSIGAPGEASRGWENIGSISERKKENVMEARPWAGETLKLGKKPTAAPKMMVFKDESSSQVPAVNNIEQSRYANQQQVTNPRTGKIERVFVNLRAVYPNPNDPNEEMSFEELRAKARGWTDRIWVAESREKAIKVSASQENDQELRSAATNKSPEQPLIDTERSPDLHKVSEARIENTYDEDIRSQKNGRIKKMKIREVKAETQTIKTNLESPTGPKLKRLKSAEPTMTLHTKAATNDILDIFNQPLGDIDLMAAQPESAGESDYEDDDYTSAGESTGTGRISGRSEFGDDDAEARNSTNREDTEIASASPWSDFTASKHVPNLDSLDDVTEDRDCDGVEEQEYVVVDRTNRSHPETNDDVDLITPKSPVCTNESYRSRFVPIPPENYQAPNGPYRDPSRAIQNRLPFMTPIVEKTESSFGAMTIRDDFDSFSSKTPSRWKGDFPEILETDELMSPIQAIQGIVGKGEPCYSKIQNPPELNTASSKTSPLNQKAVPKACSGPIIKDRQCNPTDETIKKTILDNLEPPLSSHASFFDHRPLTFSKSTEIRKFVKSLTKPSKGSAEKTSGNLSLSPSLKFPDACSSTYTVKRELGKGAFAPVYLIQEEERIDDESQQGSPKRWALKCEHPPSSWEFYIMTTVHARLASSIPDAHPSLPRSLLKPHALHLFADEAYLLEEYLDQGTLLNLVNLAKADPSGVLDETIAMFFTVELLRTIEAMHSLGILHGDLKADNCLVRLSPVASFSSPSSSASSSSSSEQWDAEYNASGSGGWSHKGLCLIDFGRSIDLHHFLPNVTFIADWKTDIADCPEMRALRPWTWQVDYWGMACIAHSLLYGKYLDAIPLPVSSSSSSAPVSASTSTSTPTSMMSTDHDNDIDINIINNNITTNHKRRWKLKEPLKRYWQTEIWASFFDACMNPVLTAEENGSKEDGGVMPLTRTLKGVREGMESWLEREGGKRGLKGGLRRLEERVKGK